VPDRCAQRDQAAFVSSDQWVKGLGKTRRPAMLPKPLLLL